MSDEFEITAQVRTDAGKGASRRLRRDADLVPAIMYGAGKDPVRLSIPHKDLYKAVQNEAFFSHIITINTDGGKDKAIIKALQRHPAKDRILHADFFRVSMDQKINVEVPLHFLNEDVCVGVKLGGGSIAHLLNSVEISCLPNDLPEFIEVDLANLEVGTTLHYSDLTLPHGAEIHALALGPEHDNAVVTVNAPRGGEGGVEETDGEAAPVERDAGGAEADAGDTEGEGGEE